MTKPNEFIVWKQCINMGKIHNVHYFLVLMYCKLLKSSAVYSRNRTDLHSCCMTGSYERTGSSAANITQFTLQSSSA